MLGHLALARRHELPLPHTPARAISVEKLRAKVTASHRSTLPVMEAKQLLLQVTAYLQQYVSCLCVISHC